MNQTMIDYCREIEEKAELFAQEEERRRRLDHIRAFNFGRMVQRTQTTLGDVALRIGWLIAGVCIGLVCSRVYPW
jgi:hypothetical protein